MKKQRKTFQYEKKEKFVALFRSLFYGGFCIVQKVKLYLKLTDGLEQWFLSPFIFNENRSRKYNKSWYLRWKSNEHFNEEHNTDGNGIFPKLEWRWRV